MTEKKKIKDRLILATQVAGTSWVVYLDRKAGRWQYLTAYHLSKQRKSVLESYLNQESVDSWLCGALGSHASRSRRVPSNVDLGCERLFAIPILGSMQLLLVGGAEKAGVENRVWKLVAESLSREETEEPKIAPVVTETLVPAIQEGVPYDLPQALDRILASIAQQVPCQGAWLAVRRGDILEIQSHWRSAQCKGVSLEIEGNPILQKVSKAHTGVRLKRGQKGWQDFPKIGTKSTTGAWGCVPLVVGQRLIGVVGLWRLREFSIPAWREFVDVVARSAPSVEVIITFTELGSHLGRLAMLNDFVLTVTSGQNLEQIAQRVFALVARAFQVETVSLHLLSSDGRVIREFHNEGGKVTSRLTSVLGHPLATVIEDGKIRTLSRDDSPDIPFRGGTSQSKILLPLKYRGRTIGMLDIESARSEALSVYDVHLMTVIAGHLAGLVEYRRLREEAEARARNLGLIHEVVQQVIGLVDKQEVVQIAAELLVQYFGYEFVIILLVDDSHQVKVCGAAGSQAPPVRTVIAEFADSADDSKGGITRHVLLTGKSELVNDVSVSDIYRSLKGWKAGSELCLPLKDGERIVGVIDIESSLKNAFDQNDFLAIESLAGILSSVISNADQYQRSQQTVYQLQNTQKELQRRIEAQREAEQKLIQAEKLAAVGEMAAGIAHELNNPLTTVTGFTELVLEELPEKAQSREDLDMVLHEAKRARDVVRRLLDFSRRSESERTRVDLNDLLNDVLTLTDHLMRTNNVQLDVSLGHSLPWVSVDRNQIKQVFLNLLHNSLQAMPNGGNLKIRTKKQRRDGRKWVQASIADTGEGIPPEIQEHIFEPFFTTKAGQGGTGLGLSVTYSIVSNHGGVIDVDSEQGKGTRFTVWLPY